MPKPILSIVIVSYNSVKFLENCLKSILKSGLKNNYEIIVVDNASSDGTSSLMAAKFKKIKYIPNRVNLGFAKANNLGIAGSSGKYVLILNPDTIVPPRTFSFLIDFMENNPAAGVSTCLVELQNGKIDDACHRGFPTPWNAFCHFTFLSRLFPGSLFFNGYHLGYRNLEKIHQIDSCSGAFMMIRRNVGEKLGWFDEDYFWYGEDLDFCYRTKKTGFRIYFIPDVKVIHYKGISSGIKKHSRHLSTADKKIRIASTRARFEVMRIFYRKHFTGRQKKLLTFVIFGIIFILEKINLLKYKLYEE